MNTNTNNINDNNVTECKLTMEEVMSSNNKDYNNFKGYIEPLYNKLKSLYLHYLQSLSNMN